MTSRSDRGLVVAEVEGVHRLDAADERPDGVLGGGVDELVGVARSLIEYANFTGSTIWRVSIRSIADARPRRRSGPR